VHIREACAHSALIPALMRAPDIVQRKRTGAYSYDACIRGMLPHGVCQRHALTMCSCERHASTLACSTMCA